MIDPRHIIQRPRKSVVALLAAAGATFGVASPALAAGTGCPTPGTASPVFAPFGDSSLYVLVPGGSFESTAHPAWTVTKGSLLAGNEPWHVGGSNDTHSLSLASGGSAESPAVCISSQQPWWRFFAVSRSRSRASKLSVWARWTDGTGIVHTTPVSTLSARSYKSWKASPRLALGSAVGTGTAVDANLFFVATGSWRIDDVYVDPYAR